MSRSVPNGAARNSSNVRASRTPTPTPACRFPCPAARPARPSARRAARRSSRASGPATPVRTTATAIRPTSTWRPTSPTSSPPGWPDALRTTAISARPPPASSPRATRSTTRLRCAAPCPPASAPHRCSSSSSSRPRPILSVACRSMCAPLRSTIPPPWHWAPNRSKPRIRPVMASGWCCSRWRRCTSRSTRIASTSLTASACRRT